MSFPGSHHSNGNRLLSVLQPGQLSAHARRFETISLSRGDIIYQVGDKIRRCYFPNDGMISLISVAQNGGSVEVGFCGFEGVIGLPVAFGFDEMPYQALVQADSECIAVDAGTVSELFERFPVFHDAVLRYSYVVLRQVSQTCICNQFHTIEARVCRWLSVMCERSGQNRLRITQEFLALMLGVQRTSVGAVAAELQDRGTISYSRGIVDVLDIDMLRRGACECYSIIRAEYRRLLTDQNRRPLSATR
jgi:CRP-like cAMP-binding protein